MKPAELSHSRVSDFSVRIGKYLFYKAANCPSLVFFCEKKQETNSPLLSPQKTALSGKNKKYLGALIRAYFYAGFTPLLLKVKIRGIIEFVYNSANCKFYNLPLRSLNISDI
ncbi:MAG: hypothetical protein GWO79_00200 [Actinobacteria bacterium]|nr:hypothetical protein [Actinomycetota bacterium]